MLGLETALGVVVDDVVAPGHVDLLTAITRLTTGPASVRDLGTHGHGLTVDKPANVAIHDPEASWLVRGTELHSRASNTPFEGRTLSTRTVHTLLRGRFTLRDGKVQ
jgi:dihydroorotase